ncbi:hypothetical protein BVX97_02095 [bacterium E08(2017)]|nr:hypothetical protein BVX97_02095 [bacterium E08(2017)]
MKKLLFLTVALSALIISSQPLISAAADKTDAALLEVLKESNQSLVRFTLDNGMTCLVKEDHSAPVVSIQFWIGTGAIHEQEYLGCGISHAIEHMIFKGTEKRKPGDISKEISNAGGRINAYTGYDRTVFHTDLPSRNWKIGLDVLSDALMNTAFPEEEWIKEKDVILREIAMGYDNPDSVLLKLHMDAAFSIHPYKYPVIGYEDTFKTLEQKDLVAFYKRNYVSDNIIAVIVGDIDATEVSAALKETFKEFKRKPRAPIVLPVEPEQVSPRFERKTGDYKISRFYYSFPTVPIHHPDSALLDIIAIITGQGKSSRLSQKIKEELQLAHHINAWSYTPKESGMFGISGRFDPEKEAELLRAIDDEVKSWTEKNFTKKEIKKAKRRLLNSELTALQNMGGQADSYASGEFYASDPRYAEQYIAQINRVTASELRDAVKRYFVPERKTTSILSPDTEETMPASEAKDSRASSPSTIHKLPNNVRVIVREDNKLPFVNICIAGKGGLLSENESNVGITALMSELLTRGTKARTAADIATDTESLGASISSFSGMNSFGLKAKSLSVDAEIIMRLLSDCLLNSQFPISEIEKQKQLQYAKIDQSTESPLYVAGKQLRELMYSGHPYQWDPVGTKATVRSLTRDALIKHAKHHIVSDNIVISVSGNIAETEALQLIKKFFSGIPRGTLAQKKRARVKPELPARIKTREPRQQAIILLGNPGIDVLDERYDAITFLQEAMSGLSSKLFVEIRDARGLAYFTGAYNRSGIDPGAYIMYAGTTEEAVPEVEALLKKEIKRVTSDGITKEELERTRNRLLSEHERSLQDPMQAAFMGALNELYGLGHEYYFSTPERYSAISSEDISSAAKSILSENSNVISIVLPEKKE